MQERGKSAVILPRKFAAGTGDQKRIKKRRHRWKVEREVEGKKAASRRGWKEEKGRGGGGVGELLASRG